MNRRNFIRSIGTGLAASVAAGIPAANSPRPNIVLVMTDDQGWGQTGYYDHPILKTPHLDAMAKNGLRLDRFYAGAPVCSPTRASVLTGRTNYRCGVLQHGYALHLQEKTIAQALKKAGYATGHFGKWHLDGLRGAGAPILESDPYHPGHFGFNEWLSVTNFFDRNPLLSRKGKFEDYKGDSSEIVVAEALKFIKRNMKDEKPSFTVIWFGTPHAPMVASEKDKKPFKDLGDDAANHYGELVAMDRSIGNLRSTLRKMRIADNTLVWFNSDNGGLKQYGPETVGGLRGFKGSIYEGGLRVPCIIEWPGGIKPRITKYPASTMDIMPTLVDLLELPGNSTLKLIDGSSLKSLFKKEIGKRKKPIPFMYKDTTVLLDNEHKIIRKKNGNYELYDLGEDPLEKNNLFGEKPEFAEGLKRKVDAVFESIKKSQGGGRITRKAE